MKAQQWGREGYRQPGAAPCIGLGAAAAPLTRLGEDVVSELFHLWFLLDLTHTIRVFLLFIHREIAHP